MTTHVLPQTAPAPAATEPDQRLAAVRDRLARAGARLRGTPDADTLLVLPPGPAPLAAGQAGIWFSEQLTPGTPLYNVPLAIRLTGLVAPTVLRSALDWVVWRHGALRTTFQVGPDGEPVQEVGAPGAVDLEVLDVTEQDLPDALRREAEQPFDLEKGPLLRARLYRINAEEHVLLTTVHHIVFDGWSADLFLKDLAAACEARHTDNGPALVERSPALPEGVPAPQFRDFAGWQARRLAGPELDAQLGYWRERLAGMPDLEIPSDRVRPATRDWRGHSARRVVPVGTEAAVRRLAESNDTTPFTVLLAAVATFLHRLSGQDDFALGVPVAGRGRTELESVIGFFVNTVPVRMDFAGRPTFHEVLRRTVTGSREDFSRPDIPFDQLVRELRRERDTGSQPLVQAMIGTESAGAPIRLGKALGREVPVDVAFAKCDIDLSVQDDGGSIIVNLVVPADLFGSTAAGRLAGQFLTLLDGLVAAPGLPVSDLELLNAAELHTVLHDWNDTARPQPERSFVERFQERCTETPDAMAVACGDESLSYRELNERANRMARLLVDRGAGVERFVAVLLRRSPDLVVALLAVLKSGAAYLPIDPDFPADRIGYMLEDAQPALLVTDASTAVRLAMLSDGTERVLVDEVDASTVVDENLPAVPSDHPAYVIYTSGSTGRPKGVVVLRSALDNFLGAMADRFVLTPADRVLATTTICFDIAGLELYLPLLSGAGVVLADTDTARDPKALLELMTCHGVTLAQATPSLWQALLPEESRSALSGVRVLVGGEALPVELARALGESAHAVTNMYGPTETTVWSTNRPVDNDSASRGSIGFPIDNTQVYVLDSGLRPTAIGVPGELFIAGAGLARGYWNRPRLTAEKFLPDPFGPPGTRMYRTGDLARWSARGDLEYLGRSDHQVKLRGFRIELGEIETALTGTGAVRRAAVVVREDRVGDKRLVAYVIPVGPADTEQLQRELSRTLPDYMVPSAIVPLSDFPMTPNGKLDRAALPAPDYGTRTTSRRPRGRREEVLCALFAEVLGLPEVAVDDNFFHLGGHSLLAFRLLACIQQEFGVEFPLRRLFTAPTAAAVADFLAALPTSDNCTGESGRTPLVAVSRGEPLPLSMMQESVWLADQLASADGGYNVPLALRLTGRLDREALRYALDRIVERHEVLRTRISVGADGVPYQLADTTGHGAVLDERDAAEAADLTDLVLIEAARGFDLASEHPLRSVLWRISGREHLLLLTAHHVAVDAWSMDLVQRELAEFYAAATDGRGPSLDPLPIQQADYAVWERARLDSTQHAAELAFWRTELAGAVATEVPGDFPRPATRSGRGGSVAFTVASEEARGIREVARRHGTTVSTVVLAALQTLLSRITGQDDIVLGSTVAGRGDPLLEKVVGCMLNTVVLRGDLAGAPTFAELIERIRTRTVEALAHQEIPFDRLMGELRAARDAGRTPPFQIMYNFSAQQPSEHHLAELAVEQVPVPVTTCKFDLVLSVVDDGSCLEGALEYASDLYLHDTARRIAASLTRLLTAAVSAPDTPLTGLPLVPEADLALMMRWGVSEQQLTSALTVHQLVEDQTDRTPQRTALRAGGNSLSFAELDDRANRLANALLSGTLGAPPITPEAPVALLLDRSPELVVAMLAVLKAGGYFIPMDPGYPPARLARIASAVAPAVVLSRGDLVRRLSDPQLFGVVPVVAVEDAASVLSRMPTHRPNLSVDPRGLIYSIFTSGSTGHPKGVAVEHIGAVRYLSWAARNYPGSGEHGTLVHSSVGFDLTMSSLLEPLVSGRGMTLLPADATLADLAHELSGPLAFDYVRLTPSHLRHLIAHWSDNSLEPAARGWVVGGEVLDPQLVERLLQLRPDAVVVNHYGPTETVIGRVVHPVRAGDHLTPDAPLPLGAPLGATRLQVLDPRLEPVPIGAVGELYIGGEGVARGYIGRAALTAERFLPDPQDQPGARMYRTGDLVRWRTDGLLDFVGRVDHQVKLRGYRIELGEIEAHLTEAPGVDRAVALVRGEQLVAYLVRAQGQAPATISALRRFCAEQLPEFMVPSQWVFLDSFPLTPHGKVDHQALPEPSGERPELEHRYVAPRTPGEQLLAELWATVLGLDEVGIEDNFFDLGGTSVAVIRLAAACNRAGVRLSPKDVFEHQTVRAQALRTIELEREDTNAPLLDTVFGAGHTGTTRTLVTLRVDGAERPLFCVHPSGGSVGWYLPIARALPQGHPVHAFQPLGMDGRESPLETIEEMAHAYLTDMRQVQPEGPYVLVGWSLGGAIAFEMARQLDDSGQQVELVLLEPTLPGVDRTIELHRPAVLSYLQGAELAERILQLPEGAPERDRLREELTEMLEAAGYSAGEVSLGDSLPMRACGQMLAALASYRPQPLRDASGVRTWFVVSTECTDASPEHPSGTSHFAYASYFEGWQALLGRDGSPETTRIPGIHATMLATEHLPTVAGHCTTALRAADARSRRRRTPEPLTSRTAQ
ncbi:amino acid adenylation domain-containing protein [Kitasatospora sp. LaBMicrA B282]|uniref:amino acid adenylation domain-containing protein n=1 Tax=Kitasatospora sp. LaBMicrA B282 TaxID=3420949 RepID=UPI003D0DF8F6